MIRLLLGITVGLTVALASPAAKAAEPQEIVLWPEGVPEPRVPAEPAEKVEKKADGIYVGGTRILQSVKVSNGWIHVIDTVLLPAE